MKIQEILKQSEGKTLEFKRDISSPKPILKTLDIEGINLERKLGVVWHSGHTLSNAAKAMSEMLKHNINT